MQLSIGNGRLAYKLIFRKSALVEDIADIFEFDEYLKFVEIKQFGHYTNWFKSL
ncbi:hypothetical protein ABNX05_20785 [Lysinibacillus sp. M3]|uniref:Uncharacterized protein n=1 Tax=Lysinibacillus zambalensis TaxID=3160866 RepID=A0ABV1MX26_9BACI